jgi:hypothetical protein
MRSINQIINSSITSTSDLLKLANELGVRINQIDFKQYLNKKVDYAILNMGTPTISGTHWIGVSNRDKLYFDPLGLPKPIVIPSDYKYKHVAIQNPRFGRCGQYVLLWFYYLQHGRLPEFFELFKQDFEPLI